MPISKSEIQSEFFNQAQGNFREGFQAWAKPVCALLHDNAETINVIPTQGDGGIDFFVPRQGVFYQVTAPMKQMSDREVVKKIDEDFPKAYATLGASLKTWRLIINLRALGLQTKTSVALSNWQAKYPQIALSVWPLDELWIQLMSPVEKSQERLDKLAKIFHLDNSKPNFVTEAGEAVVLANSGQTIYAELEKLVQLRHHAVLDLDMGNSQRKLYLVGLAIPLCAMQTGNFKQEAYIRAISNLLNLDIWEQINTFAKSVNSIPFADLQALLVTPQRQFCWFADAAYLICIDGAPLTDGSEALISFARSMNLSRDHIEQFLQHMQIISLERDPKIIINSIKVVARNTMQWKTILAHRGVRIGPALGNFPESGFWNATKKQLNLMSEIAAQRWKVMNGMGMGEEGILMRTALYMIRSSCISSMKELTAKVRDFEAEYRSFVEEANNIGRMFGDDRIAHSKSLADIKPDENTSIENEEWHNNMDQAYDKLSNYLDAVGDVINDLSSALLKYQATY